MVLASSRPDSSQVRTWCWLSPAFSANSSAGIIAIFYAALPDKLNLPHVAYAGGEVLCDSAKMRF
jgi:hypothetical protein